MKLATVISAITLATLLTACDTGTDQSQTQTTASEEITAAVRTSEVVIDDATGVYTINWTLDQTGAPVEIAVSSRPDGAGREVLAQSVTTSSFEWSPEADEFERHYFILTPQNGESIITAARLLPLEGGRNFRDLGGYKTTDGRTVQWGKVYRSGVMDDLTDNDYDYLSDLGIKVICDFRDNDERAREPTNWGAGNIDYLTFADPVKDADPRNNPMFAALMSPDSTPEDVAAGMADSYFDIAMDEREGYTEMFDRLATGNIPLAFNCSAGKDRAGTAAALILTVLGVPRETVVYDYSLSDKYVDYMEEFAGEDARAKAANDPDNPYAFLMQLPPEKLAPLMASDPHYIEASFAEMEKRYGSVMAFIQTELDVSDEELKLIRDRLLN